MKRIFDVVSSLIGLLLIWPLLVVLGIWVKLDSAGPVFYRGVRAGKSGKPFRIFKLRTMVVNADQIGGAETPNDDPRITRSGNFLRHYKLDELPQLINVLKGDMSVVGPRPEVMDEVLVERTGVRHRGGHAGEPGVGRGQHPDPVGDAAEGKQAVEEDDGAAHARLYSPRGARG